MAAKQVIQREIVVAGTRLKVPSGLEVSLLSTPGDGADIDYFLTSSPDFTMYHTRQYLEAVGRYEAPADLILLQSNGHPLVAFPCVRKGYQLLSSGYSGIVLPGTARASQLRAGVSALGLFIAANPSVRFGFMQSLQSKAYRDSRRLAAIDASLSELPLGSPPLFSRYLDLSDLSLPLVSLGWPEQTLRMICCSVTTPIRATRFVRHYG